MGVVESARVVTTEGTRGEAGAIAGGDVTGSDKGSAVGAILGTVAGGAVGSAIERYPGSRRGFFTAASARLLSSAGISGDSH